MRGKVSVILVSALLAVPCMASADKAASKKAKTIGLSLDGRSWSLLLDLREPSVDIRQDSADGTGAMIQVSSRKTGVIASMFLEETPRFQSTLECKKHYWPLALASALPKTRIEHVDMGSMAAVYWLVEEYQGARLMQRNVNAYMYRDGVCVDIHLSKVGYRPKDDELFAAILRTARFSEEDLGVGGLPAGRIPVPAHGAVVLEVPDGWHAKLDNPAGDLPPTLSMQPGEGDPFDVRVTVFWDAMDRPGYNSAETITAMVEMARDQVASRAVETVITLLALGGDRVAGKYFKVTDRAVKPGEYRFLTHGCVALADLVLTFTIMSNDELGTVESAALEMLRGARKVPA